MVVLVCLILVHSWGEATSVRCIGWFLGLGQKVRVHGSLTGVGMGVRSFYGYCKELSHLIYGALAYALFMVKYTNKACHV